MSYALIIWTVVAMAGENLSRVKERDWRQIAEFHAHIGDATDAAKGKCETAAAQMGIDPKNYRCVKLK